MKKVSSNSFPSSSTVLKDNPSLDSRSVVIKVLSSIKIGLGFSLFNLQDRGELYIGPNTEVYEGMVIGNTAKGEAMTVNPTKGKQLSNMRSSGADEAINLTKPIEITIERGLEMMSDDEYLEITPHNIRLRKQVLNEGMRKKTK